MPQPANRISRPKDRTEVEPLDTLVGYNLKRAYMIFQDDFRKTLGDSGLTPRAFAVLTLIAQIPSVTQSAISRHLGIERSGLVAIVDDLEKRGLVLRVAVPGERRVQALAITDNGKRAHKISDEAVRKHEERLLSVFSRRERQTLLDLLSRLRNWKENLP
ncbi:MAG: MarR family winged helix-turn-helix transcriptional regulator [Geminicoccaceae bacterium]